MLMCNSCAGTPNCHLYILNPHLDVTRRPNRQGFFGDQPGGFSKEIWTPKMPGRLQVLGITPRKINMEPENAPLEEENHLPNHQF